MTTTDTTPAPTTTAAAAGTSHRTLRMAALLGLLVAGVLTLFVGAGPASASTSSTQTRVLYTPGGTSAYSSSASQSGWTGTVTVSGNIWVYKRGCAALYQQGRNDVTGYGAWVYEGTWCGVTSTGWSVGSFSFAVHDYYSDSVALKICDNSGCRSAHVWN